MHFPLAVFKGPIPNENHDGMVFPVQGLVLHVEQGSESSANNWFHNPGAQASAHFGNPKTGPLDQWVDSNDEAWAEMAGNRRWISVEHEGFSGEQLTETQLENDAHLFAWVHLNYPHVVLQITNDPVNGWGLGWHGMGGVAWGNHPDCPGPGIIAARTAIIERAKVLLASRSSVHYLLTGEK